MAVGAASATRDAGVGTDSGTPNKDFTQEKKPPPAGTTGVTGAAGRTAGKRLAATGIGCAAATGAGCGRSTGVGAGVSGRMPLMTGSCLALVFSRRVMPTSSSCSSTMV